MNQAQEPPKQSWALGSVRPSCADYPANSHRLVKWPGSRRNWPIGRQHLFHAIEREYQKAGKAFPGLPHGAAPEPPR